MPSKVISLIYWILWRLFAKNQFPKWRDKKDIRLLRKLWLRQPTNRLTEMRTHREVTLPTSTDVMNCDAGQVCVCNGTFGLGYYFLCRIWGKWTVQRCPIPAVKREKEKRCTHIEWTIATICNITVIDVVKIIYEADEMISIWRIWSNIGGPDPLREG